METQPGALAVLNVSLDAQIVAGALDGGAPLLGDTIERQRRYAARLGALHVVVKTGRLAAPERVPLAENAWAYPTRSRSRYLFLVDAYRIGAAICRRQRIDVISAQDPFATGLVAWALARRFGQPLNVQLHFDVLDNPHWLRERPEHRLLNALGKWLLRHADTVRVGTTRERDRLASWGIDAGAISVAPVPVALEEFAGATPDLAVQALRAPGEAVVLNASRLVPQKDLPTFLRAAGAVLRRRPATRFVIAGDGPQRDRLELLARQLEIQDQVHFLGLVDRALMPGLMAAADVLAVSSVYEGTSLVAVQAAAAGKPVVTTAVAGSGDTVVDGVTGRVVPVGDPAALADALMEVLADPPRAAQMGHAAQAHVRARFDHARAVDAVIAMWSRTARTARTAQRTSPDRPRLGASAPGRWLYLANARIPNEKAHSLQIFRMLDAFAHSGVDVELAYAARANLPGLAGRDPIAYYQVESRPRLATLPSLDAVKLVTIDFAHLLNHAPLPALSFALQQVSFALSAAVHARRSGAGVVYSRDWPVLAAVAVTRPRGVLVWEAHDLPQSGAARSGLRRLLPHLDRVVAISGGLRDDLAAMGVPLGHILVAPDAVDPARFAGLPCRAQARAALSLPPDGRIVAYTGHLYRWKGAHTLALASRSLPGDALVVIVGGTPADLTQFERFVAGQRLTSVRLVGHVPPEQVPTWLAAADVLALPNSAADAISARYTSPLKLFEYMAAGRPIVASDLPSIREVLAHGRNAYLVPPDDPQALAAGIKAVLDDPGLGQALAAEARQEVQGRTWDARARAIVSFVAGAAKGREGS